MKLRAILAVTACFFVMCACTPADNSANENVPCENDTQCQYAQYCYTEYSSSTGTEQKYCVNRPPCGPYEAACPKGFVCNKEEELCEREGTQHPADEDTAGKDSDAAAGSEADVFADHDSFQPENDIKPDIDTFVDKDTVNVNDSAADTDKMPDADTGVASSFEDDFEKGAAKWTLEGDWEIGAPASGPNAAHGGANVAATKLGGNYSNSAKCNMILASPVAIKSAPETSTLEFYAFVDTEGSGAVMIDYMEVLVREGTTTWDAATKMVFSDASNPAGLLDSATKTKIGGNIDATYHLFKAAFPSAFAGKSVQIGFRFTSDANSPKAGIYLDDVRIY